MKILSTAKTLFLLIILTLAMPAQSLDESFVFAVIADPHASQAAKYEVEKYGSHVDRFLHCVKKMEMLDQQDRPDFILICGDIHLWELEKHLDQVSFPLHVIAGNNESGKRRKEMREKFPQDFQVDGQPSDYYSFLHKGVLFIAMCDASMKDHVGHLASEDIIPSGQCEWLERELSRPEKEKILFAHIPPHPNGLDSTMFLSRNDSRFFNDLIFKTQPMAMFFGHQHLPTRECMFGVTRSFIVRSCAWNFESAPIGFLLVRVHEKGMDVREIILGE
ncbi:metallophosphoesterase [candidate division KSB1 bacterium]|nr:metallophosphoesterase [candidate division KSB1 bacterium]